MASNRVYLFLILPIAFFVYLSLFHSQRDLFPFYSWDMFSSASRNGQDFQLRIECVDSRCELDQPLYENIGEYLGNHDKKVYFLIQRMGDEIQSSGGAAFPAIEADLLRYVFKQPSRIRYRLVRRDFDVVEFARSKTVKESRLVATRECVKSETGGFQCSSF